MAERRFLPDPAAGSVSEDGLPEGGGQSGGFCGSGRRAGSVSQFFRSSRNSAARKAAPPTMIPAAMIAASQPWEFFLGRWAIWGRSLVQ